MFYVIPTPIGNLKDITDRSKEILGSLDILYCENPQRTNLMLKVYTKQYNSLLHCHYSISQDAFI